MSMKQNSFYVFFVVVVVAKKYVVVCGFSIHALASYVARREYELKSARDSSSIVQVNENQQPEFKVGSLLTFDWNSLSDECSFLC